MKTGKREFNMAWVKSRGRQRKALNRILKLWIKNCKDKNITSKGIGAEKLRGESRRWVREVLVETEG